jgi:hypothetical protein
MAISPASFVRPYTFKGAAGSSSRQGRLPLPSKM